MSSKAIIAAGTIRHKMTMVTIVTPGRRYPRNAGSTIHLPRKVFILLSAAKNSHSPAAL
ncbi:MAG TPA: hypothetical protein VHN74_21240 [Candidatus Angelobacter sp.]|jgi:hypothetical protein|nr:hypothetical protein [Candidatus Angelobacter sp.]